MKPKQVFYTLGGADGHEPMPCENLQEWASQGLTFSKLWRVALAELDGVRVSTVFLGMDHNWSGDGPPLVFETMVFGGTMEGECQRYSTWVEAEAGHTFMVEKVKAAL